MAQQFYNPFSNFSFDSHTCFLSGNKLANSGEEIFVFPEWLMEEYQLKEKPFKLLDDRISVYQDLKIPCSTEAFQSIEPLENEIRSAFLQGYEAVTTLPELKLFQWIGKMVYGILFNEIRIGIREQKARNEELVFSQSLIHKFKNLHFMLQSLIRPVDFEGALPWSIEVFRLDTEQDLFNYRDEINTLTFSLSLKNFGIIACLQDNGTNGRYHKEVIQKVDSQPLHQIQFEEMCARFYYSNYLFNRLPEYTILPTETMIFIEPMPLRSMGSKPIFDEWQNKVYAQVLENFWKPWGLTFFEIFKDPENPVSFLFDNDGTFRPSSKVELPS